jgi:Flp pilus assembly pilin Flp
MQKSGDLLGAQQIVLGAVEKQVKGTAEATVTSQQKAALAFGEVQEQVGGKLLPVLNTVLDLFSRFSGVIIPVAAAIAGLVIAVKAYQIAQQLASAATAIWSGIQAVFNAIMLLNPIMLIVIAIVALIAIIVVAYMKIGWFRDGVQAAWDGVKAAFDMMWNVVQAVFNWIKDHWPLLLAIITGPIGIAVLLITKNFDTIKDVAMTMVNWVMDRFQDLTGFLSRIVGSIQGILTTIADAIKYPIDAATAAVQWVIDKFNSLVDFFRNLVNTISGYVSDIADAITGPINAVIRAWNNLSFTVPKIHVPGTDIDIGGNTINFPDIPTLATGGLVMRTGLALVHEGETFSGVGKSSKPATVNITVNTTGLGADAPQIQKAVVSALRNYTSRNGALNLPIAGMA